MLKSTGCFRKPRRRCLGFRTALAQPKKNTKAQNDIYKGLTYDDLGKYIAAHDDEDTNVMDEYWMLRGLDEESEEAGIESLSYLEMKAWFLDKFLVIRGYHEKREKLMNAVAEREEKRKEALKDKTALR